MSSPGGASFGDLETLDAVARDLADGTRSVSDYIDSVCGRIEERDPSILALLPEPDQRARMHAEAAAIEARFPPAERRPPLYGVPVAVKDIFHVDGLVTRAGSALPPEVIEGWFGGVEATSVARLRGAGALVVGKTVTTEFAYFEPGATRNPWNLAHTPGGSSSGSAAAVAAGFAPLALGSQTVGSVIRPAAFCGVVGFKPTYDRIPTGGVLYYSQSVDHVGLFSRGVVGAALAASVLLDGWDARAHEAQDSTLPVLGVPDGAYLDQAETEGRAAFESQLARLAAAGVEVRRVPALDDIDAITARHRAVATYEFARVHDRWFAQYGSLYRPRTAALVEAGRRISEADRDAGAASRLELRARLHALMDEHGLNVWASPPASGPAPEGIGSTGNPAMNLPWTHAGVPALTLPAGLAANGLPLGLQLSARFGADERLLAWATTIEPLLTDTT